MVTVTVTQSGAQLGVTLQGQADKVRKQVAQAMRQALPAAKATVRGEITANLKVRKAQFPNVMTGQVMAPPGKLPVMVFYPRPGAGWIKAHVEGAVINGAMIPLNAKSASGRIGHKRWKEIIRNLNAQGNLDFRTVGGKILVFAETAAAREKVDGRRVDRLRAFRQKQDGAKKRDKEVAIAIYLPTTRLPKRLDFAKVAGKIGAQVTAAIESTTTPAS